jgi:hypothetical protein
MRRLCIYFSDILDKRLLTNEISNQQIPFNQSQRRMFLTVPHSPSLFMLVNEHAVVNGDIV